ncbi:MAG: hypothetical protein M1497_10830 [Nitrospirae bacterium]|nr:hypothetical protein [Nitrospirota bacterium]
MRRHSLNGSFRSVMVVLFVFAMTALAVSPARAEERSITLPKGTIVERVHEGHYTFMLPDGQTIEARGCDMKKGQIDHLEITDTARPERAPAFGNQGTLTECETLSEDEVENSVPGDYMVIDGEARSLPAKIVYEGM